MATTKKSSAKRRPKSKVGRDVQVNVWMTRAQRRSLHAEAKRMGVSVNSFVLAGLFGAGGAAKSEAAS